MTEIHYPTWLHDMPAEAYHARPELSKSQLDNFLVSPAHYKWFRDNPRPATKAMDLGTAVHTMVLEPHLGQDLILVNDESRNSNAYKAFAAEHPEAVILKSEDFDKACRMRDSVLSHRYGRMLFGEGAPEVSLFWRDHETEIPLRGRADWLRKDGIMVDFKTTACAAPDDFARAAIDRGYHLQAAMYIEAYTQITGNAPDSFVFAVVESQPPYLAAFYVLPDELIQAAKRKIQAALWRFADCLQTDTWPGYPDTIMRLDPPAWMKRKIEEEELAA